MTSAQHSSLPAGVSPTSASAQVTVPPSNAERIPLQLENMDAAQVTNLMKNLLQKVCKQQFIFIPLPLNTSSLSHPFVP